MTLQIKNIQYFEWEVPEKLTRELTKYDYNKLQQLIDEYFIPEDNPLVEQISDDYYELEHTNE